jgi:hypothetical protein
MPNSIVYFDITIGGAPAGRLTFDLYDDVVPKASQVAALSEMELTRIDSRELQAA